MMNQKEEKPGSLPPERKPYQKPRIIYKQEIALMRTLTRVDAEGKIAIPQNIHRALGLNEGQLVELSVIGAGKKHLLVSLKESAKE